MIDPRIVAVASCRLGLGGSMEVKYAPPFNKKKKQAFLSSLFCKFLIKLPANKLPKAKPATSDGTL